MSRKNRFIPSSNIFTTIRQHSFKTTFTKLREYVTQKVALLRSLFMNTINKILHSIWLKYFLIFVGVYTIALFPLLRANYDYNDDINRNYSGIQDFGYNRTTSDLLSGFLNDGTYLTDLSPFTQILAILIIALASTLVIKLITSSINMVPTRVNFWYIVAALPIALQPYYLENFSYKFDSPYMALSILFSILPFFCYRTAKHWRNYAFIIASIIGAILMCTTYQSSSGIFPALTIILAFAGFLEKRPLIDIIRFTVLSAVAYCCGVLFFQVFIMEPVDGYVSNTIWPLAEIIPGAIDNFKTYKELFFIDMRQRWLIVVAIVLLSFVVTSTIRTKRNRFVTIIATVFVLAIILALSFGAYPLIVRPLTAPRAMYGIFVNLAFISILTVTYRYSYFSKFCTTYLAYAFLVLTLTYGNALNVQKRYESYHMQLIVNSLNGLSPSKPINVYLEGTLGYSEKVQHLFSKYPILPRLIPATLSADNQYWGLRQITYEFPLPGVSAAFEGNPDLNKLSLVKSTRTHDIYQKDGTVVIKLKNKFPIDSESIAN